MNKSSTRTTIRILPLTSGVLLALGSLVTHAEPVAGAEAAQVYGQARLHVLNRSDDFGTSGTGTSLQSYSSRLGVKGNIKTNIEGVDAFYKMEMLYDTTDAVSGDNLKGRDALAGLKGNFGSIKVGRLSVAYKGTLTKIDPWNDSEMQSRGFGGKQGSSALHSSYFNKALEYVSPKMGGVTLAAWTSQQFDNTTTLGTLHNAGPIKEFEGGSASGVGLKYDADNLFVGVDMIDINADNITNAKLANDSGMQIGARYKMGSVSVAGFYEDVEDIGLGKNTWLNVIYKQGNTRYIAGYGTNTDARRFNNEESATYNVGAVYSLNKTSQLFAAYNSRSEDNSGNDFNTITAGLNLKFGY